MDEVWIPIIMFLVIGAIVITATWLKSRERLEMQSTLRAAIDKGQPVPREVIEALTRNVKVAPTSLSDLRTGVIWTAVGIGIAGFGVLIGMREDEALHPLLGVACIPGMIGLAYILLSFFNPNKFKPA